MKQLLIAIILLTTNYQSVKANKIATITGSIKESIAFEHQGQFHQTAIKFYFDTPLNLQEFVEIPDELGNFTLSIPIDAPTPLYFEYGDQTGYLFLSPNDNLKMSFVGRAIDQTLQFDGVGKEHNAYLAKYHPMFCSFQIEEDLAEKRELTSVSAYSSYCESLKLKEQAFLRQYLTTHTTSPSFKTWAKAEIKYRTALRISKRYFNTPDKRKDGYQQFANQYTLNDPTALLSNQYLTFLDYHLRHLCLRDSDALRAARQERSEPWIFRGYELGKQIFTGRVKEHVLGKIVIDMIGGEFIQAINYYNDLMQFCKDPTVKKLVEKHYSKLDSYLSATPPSDANLMLIEHNNKLNFKQLLAKYRGKAVYIDFWASWCGPCLAEMPYAKTLQQKYKGKDIVFLYLCADETDGKWRANIARYQLSGDHYLMNHHLRKDAYKTLGIGAIPHYALIDKNGNIIEKMAHKPSTPELINSIEQVIRQ